MNARHVATPTASLLLCASLGLLGCGGGSGGYEKKPAATPATATATGDAATKLTAADKLDGAEDKTVHKCSGCALGMDGKAEHAAKAAGYEFHFCSDYCKKEFEKDPDGAIAAMKVPTS